MKRSGPPKRKKPLLRGKVLPTAAKRVPERYRQYSADRIEYLKANPRCAGRRLVPIDGCKTWATDVHHKRGRTGEDLLDQEHWVALCRPCHTWVEANPAAARDLGLKERRNQAR